jgi:predicted flap endonuclease-1-like 5' DNA nuclease
MTAAWPLLLLLVILLAFTAGWFVSKSSFSRRAQANGLRVSRQQYELERLRAQYRRRRKIMREAMRRERNSSDQLRQALAEREGVIATERSMAADHQIRAAVSEARVAELDAEIESLRGDVRAAREKISATQAEHGLLRIEHGELIARTLRLRALTDAAAIGVISPQATPTATDTTRADAGALRQAVSERDATIHELTCKLQETSGRALELDTQLRTWKHRVAPLVLQLRIQRERNRKLREILKSDSAPPAPLPAASPPAPAGFPVDDLKQIRGIGRSIERKLHSQGIFRFRQLAELNATDLASLAAKLSIPSARPWRDRWIDQARVLSGESNAA